MKVKASCIFQNFSMVSIFRDKCDFCGGVMVEGDSYGQEDLPSIRSPVSLGFGELV